MIGFVRRTGTTYFGFPPFRDIDGPLTRGRTHPPLQTVPSNGQLPFETFIVTDTQNGKIGATAFTATISDHVLTLHA